MAKAKAKPFPEVIGLLNQQAWSAPPEKYAYKNRSTVCFYPVIADLPWRVVQSWLVLQKPMNQLWAQIPLPNMEVGAAYETMVDILRSNPDLKKWKYVLTLETDNVPPPDGLIKLQEDMETHPEFDAIGGLYWTKGEGGQPMCYGKTDVFPKDFMPWLPPKESVAECHGLGMGFTLFRMKMFLDEKFVRPLFKTEQTWEPGKGIRAYTQDLRFFSEASRLGYRMASSTRCLVGHYDKETDKVW